MEFKGVELCEILRALKILREGEMLLGVDVNKKLADSLIQKISARIGDKTSKKTDAEVKQLVKEAECLKNFEEETGERYDFDSEFGPNYPHTETLKTIEKAIANGKNLKIKYFSASQGKFTEREVKPVTVERRGGAPYLNAFCFLRNDDRVFKLGRIKNIKIIGVKT